MLGKKVVLAHNKYFKINFVNPFTTELKWPKAATRNNATKRSFDNDYVCLFVLVCPKEFHKCCKSTTNP